MSSRPSARLAPLLALAAACLLAAPARADESLGLERMREGRAKLQSGDAQGAIESLLAARIERPDDPLVAQLLADAYVAAGRLDEGLVEYERGEVAPFARRARFNRSTTLDRRGEERLAAGGVPPSVELLPEGPQPEMLKALDEAIPDLDGARRGFLGALDVPGDEASDRAARESVAALNRRVDELRRMQEELNRRKQDQQQDQKQDQKQDQQQDQKDQQDQQDQPQDQQDQPPPDDPAQAEQAEPPPAPQRELSPEEVKQLLARLAQLEQEAQQREKAREAARRRAVEKDW